MAIELFEIYTINSASPASNEFWSIIQQLDILQISLVEPFHFLNIQIQEH